MKGLFSHGSHIPDFWWSVPSKTLHQQDLILSSYNRALFRDTGQQAQNLRDFTKITQHLTEKRRQPAAPPKGISTCTEGTTVIPENRRMSYTYADRNGAIPSWNDLAVWLGRLMIHTGSDLWPPITKQQIPQVQINTPHTEVDEYLEGSEREMRGGWEGLAMKKQLWKKKKYGVWFGQGKEQDIPGRHKHLQSKR